MRFAALVIALAGVGCLRSAAYHCGSADECTHDGVQGRCEASNVCSFPDPGCPSGHRFGDLAGTDSNQCVGGSDDGGIDAPGDGVLSDVIAHSCPVGYAAISGVPDHMYRKLLTAAAWDNHRTACHAEGGNIYLAIPDDATELQAIATLAGADVWVGIDDQAVEGSYVTVLGPVATFLPWGPGEPDNAGNQDCVEALSATTKLATLKCTTALIAVCECVP